MNVINDISNVKEKDNKSEIIQFSPQTPLSKRGKDY